MNLNAYLVSIAWHLKQFQTKYVIVKTRATHLSSVVWHPSGTQPGGRVKQQNDLYSN